MKTGISRSLRARSESQCAALHCSFLADSYTSFAQITSKTGAALTVASSGWFRFFVDCMDNKSGNTSANECPNKSDDYSD